MQSSQKLLRRKIYQGLVTAQTWRARRWSSKDIPMSYTDGGDTSQDSENNPNIIPNGLDSILSTKGFSVLSGNDVTGYFANINL